MKGFSPEEMKLAWGTGKVGVVAAGGKGRDLTGAGEPV
jgi:hypothetical protein